MIKCHILLESGCNFNDKEYTVYISDISGDYLSIDEVDLISEAIYDNIDPSQVNPNGYTEVLLQRDGEFEDVFWNSFFKVLSVKIIESV